MATMNDVYKDGSNHKICEKCGFCKTCGDCKKYGCKMEEETVRIDIKNDLFMYCPCCNKKFKLNLEIKSE